MRDNNSILTRAVAEIIPRDEFIKGFESGKKLRFKMGFDPTKPTVHLGWFVGLRKLRQFQDLGHTVVIIIGDWTACIGDPSGVTKTRKMLTADEVKPNAHNILRQFYKILDETRTEIRWQSEWYDRFTLNEIIDLTSRFTVAQLLERSDFTKRYTEHKPIGIHELLYPILQGFDSIAVEADVEVGGIDQKLNCIIGRELQRRVKQNVGPIGKGQAVLLTPLLLGYTRDDDKMSQSLNNYIGISDTPDNIYGKIMSISDPKMIDYFDLLTDVTLIDIIEAVKVGGRQVMEYKMELSHNIVAQLYDNKTALSAAAAFNRH